MNKIEYSLIALLLNYPEYYQKMSKIENIFTDKDCRVIYDTMIEQVNFTASTVREVTKKEVSDVKYEEIYRYDFYEERFDSYLDYILSNRIIRDLIIYADKLRNNYKRHDVIADEVQNIIGKINKMNDQEIQSTKEIITEMQQHKRTVCKLVPACVPYIDRYGGLEQTDYIIIAARPSDGKTTKALNLMGEDITRKLRIGFFTTETNNKKVMSILACMIAGVKEIKYRTNTLDMTERDRLARAFEILYETEMYLDGTPRLYLDSLKRKAREMVKKYGVEKIYVDYLQRIKHYDRRIIGRYELITYISGELKALAVELGVPIVCLAQLNREHIRNDEEPKISNLKGSGDIEQDADIIILLHPEVELEEDREQVKNIVGKYRNGPKGYYTSVWDKPLRRMVFHE